MPDGIPDIPVAPPGRYALVRESAWGKLEEAVGRISPAVATGGAAGGPADDPGSGGGPISARWLSTGPGPSAWTRVVRSGGAWVDAAPAGTTTHDPAYEANSEEIEAGTIVTLRRAPLAGDWIAFQPACSKCRVVVTVLKCDGTPAAGATVQIGDETRIADLSGRASIPIPEAGTYTISVTYAGAGTVDREFDLDCGSEVTVRIPTQKLEWCARVAGCNGPVDGAEVILERVSPDPLDGLGTGVTDGNGCYKFDLLALGLGPGTYRMRARKLPRYPIFGNTGPVNLACGLNCTCGPSPGINIQLVANTGDYRCACSCPYPISSTLYLTNKWGTVVLAADTTGSVWRGCQTITTNAATLVCYCTDLGSRIPTEVSSAPVSLQWFFDGASCSLQVNFNVVSGADAAKKCVCPGMVFLANNAACDPYCIPCTPPPTLDCSGFGVAGSTASLSMNCESRVATGSLNFTVGLCTFEATPITLSEAA